MVAQQLTPELMQPNVLVEIDHGPLMGLYRETSRPRPGRPLAQIPDTMSSTSESSIPKSYCRGPGPEPTACDVSPKSSCDSGGYAASIKMQSAGTRTELLEDGRAPSAEGFPTSWQPSGPHCSKLGPSAPDTWKEELVVMGMHHLLLDDVVVEPLNDAWYLMAKNLGDVGTHPEGIRQRNLFDTPHSANASMRRRTKSVTESVRTGTLGSVSATDDVRSCAGFRSILIPSKHHNTLLTEIFESDDNEKWMAEANNSDVFETHGGGDTDERSVLLPQQEAFRREPHTILGQPGEHRRTTCDKALEWCEKEGIAVVFENGEPCFEVLDDDISSSLHQDAKYKAEVPLRQQIIENSRHHFHYDLPMRVNSSGLVRGTRSSSKKKGLISVEPPPLTSWATGTKTSEVEESAREVEESAREVLMWMIEYNLMTSHSDKQKLVALAHQLLDQLLPVMEAAVSCVDILLSHQLVRHARDKQCTGQCHCLLDDPG